MATEVTWHTDLHVIIQKKLQLLQLWVLPPSITLEIAKQLKASAYYIYTAQKMNLLFMMEEAELPAFNIQVFLPLYLHGLPSTVVKLVVSKTWMRPLA
jgi:hypothetical protein